MTQEKNTPNVVCSNNDKLEVFFLMSHITGSIHLIGRISYAGFV